MKEAGLPEPEFINKRNEFVVILYNNETETVINNEADLLSFCKEPRTREQIASILEPSERFKRKTFINKIADIQINSILKQVMKKIETLPEDLKQVALKEYMKVSEQVSGQSYEANINGKTPVEVVKQLQAKFIPESKGKKDALDVIVKLQRNYQHQKII